MILLSPIEKMSMVPLWIKMKKYYILSFLCLNDKHLSNIGIHVFETYIVIYFMLSAITLKDGVGQGEFSF